MENTAAADGFSETLRAPVAGFTPDVTAAAGVTDVSPDSSNSAAFSATLSTSAAGTISGMVSFDLASLAATANLADTVLSDIAGNVVGVPEPATLALLACGVIGLLLRRRPIRVVGA